MTRRMLPIDALGEAFAEAVTRHPTVVLEAEPGAGKTTRVPRFLLDDPQRQGEIWVLQPRRLAARMAARWVAQALGEPVGATVGYQVRFDSQRSAHTRVLFVTEGLVVRRLIDNPHLEGVDVLVFDEFHERHLDADLAFAWARHLQATHRPDLKVVVMSATLAPLGGALDLQGPVLRAPGRVHPVEVTHLRQPDRRPVHEQVASAVPRAFAQSEGGHVLAFLPGTGEIRRCQEALARWAATTGAEVLPLHGSLSPAEQDRAVQPQATRKVILATNVAETSVTVDGVTAVVDSGWARVAGVEPWSGFNTLRLRPISQASARQRMGRAGRTEAGHCYRLYTEHDFRGRAPHIAPEVARLDLAQARLTLARMGVAPEDLPWLDPPVASRWEAAHTLLQELGALENGHRLTEIGKALSGWPLHPRLGRMVLAAHQGGASTLGLTAAALLSEGDVRDRESFVPTAGESDLVDLADRIARASNPVAQRRAGLRPDAVRRVQQAVQHMRRHLPSTKVATATDPATVLARALVLAYPDRVAQSRAAGGRRQGAREVQLRSGRRARLDERSAVRDAPWLVALAGEERGGGGGAATVVQWASALDPEWLGELFPERIIDTLEAVWDAEAGRVWVHERLQYGALVLADVRRAPQGEPKAVELLARQALARGWEALDPDSTVRATVRRLQQVRAVFPNLALPSIDDADLETVVRQACEEAFALSTLTPEVLLATLRQRLGPELWGHLERLAPTHLQLSGGRRVRVNYEESGPVVATWLQDFFGEDRTPRVGDGRIPVTLHLLAPNRRPVQVTQDLGGFWERHYPTLRRSLARRYPKHAWPEDPRNASPPPVRQRRRSPGR